METNQQPPDERDQAADQEATHQQDPVINSHTNNQTLESGSTQEEPLPQADVGSVELLESVETSQLGNTQDPAEPMQTENK